MNKTYLTAGIVIVIGVIIMAISVAMMLAISPDYWHDIAYGSAEDYIEDGKLADVFNAIFDVGLLVVFMGIAIVAFGLATAEPKPQQYRPVETMIPSMQYPPPPRQ